MNIQNLNQNIAIIPARGGSKRIPRKNIRLFLGKPIIAYSIEIALKSQLFSEVMVSTEDPEIAEIAEHYGAKVPFLRSKENASDTATTTSVLLEVLHWYKRQNIIFDYGCCIYPTAVLLQMPILRKAYKILLEKEWDCVFPVQKFEYPIWRALEVTTEGKIKMIFPQYLQTPTQSLPEAYKDAGQFYFFNTFSILSKKQLWTNHTSYILLSEIEAQDIDTLEDWKIAEMKYNWLKAQTKQ